MLGNDEGKGGYLTRCKPYYEAAYTAYEAAQKLELVSEIVVHVDEVDKSTKYLAKAVDPFTSFWVGEPDPTVPLPPAAVSPVLDRAKLTPILRTLYEAYSVASPRRETLTLDLWAAPWSAPHDGPSTCTISTALVATCTAAVAKTFIDVRPGARPIIAKTLADGSTPLLDEHGVVLADALQTEFASSRGDGTVVAYGRGAMRELHGGKTVRSDIDFVRTSGSTQQVENWVLFKGRFRDEFRPDGAYPGISVVDLRDGLDAKPVVLSATEAIPQFGLRRTYGVCIADSLFVNMDPKLAIGTRDGTWRLQPLELPMKGRRMTCAGNAAIVTDWYPLAIQRCTQTACTPLSVGDYHGDLQDQFVADEKTLYALRDYEGALLVTAVPLAHPEQRKTVFIAAFAAAGSRWESLDLVGGAAVITMMDRGDAAGESALFAIAVGPDGKVLDVLSNAK